MEEVWKDINFSSLNDQNTRPMLNTRSTFGGGVILQEFLTGPINLDPPKNIDYSSNNSSSSVASDHNNNNNNGSFYCSAPPPPPPLVTALSLNSNPDFHFDPLVRQNKNNNSQLLLHHQQQQQQKVSACFVNPPSYEQNVGSNCFASFGKTFGEPDISPCERRNKRMIKNRESAARSRARKQEKIAPFYYSLNLVYVCIRSEFDKIT
ncbi:hypothetical protein TSUD_234730 [Trifolium subterraneum]|uniref:BZIP domain-containing protein n=1 Tax=Trifolium subterraneum TaxID=3900 RepID=A0A2Z6LTM1_TRISU|nr:hypothetical protein TSUD_234730 [Trifolium subterraneum]